MLGRNSLLVIVVKHLNRLPSKVVNALKHSSGSIQSQAGWGCEQPGVEGGVPAYSRGLELGEVKGPFQPKLFCNSMISDAMILMLLCLWLLLFWGIQKTKEGTVKASFIIP